MAKRDSGFTAGQRTLSGLAILFLVLAVFFGFLNSQKMKALRAGAASAQAGRDTGPRLEARSDAAPAADEQSKIDEAENRATKAEAELAEIQKQKADLQTSMDAKQQEITSLQKRVEEADKNSSATASTGTSAAAQNPDLQSQIDDLRRQLEGAEKEKTFLAAKLQDAQEHGTPVKDNKKRRETASAPREAATSRRTGVRGTVLAYNQAYNFVVLNLGARNGVETNSEMLVLRDGTLIGKIRISSVEPATAIGDILTNSLARGVQVQPGDTVIYAGTSP